jgi:hypothetical protein
MQRKHTKPKRAGQVFGIDLYPDSKILRFAVMGAHFQAVAPDSDFPLAHADDRDWSNTTITIAIVRVHPNEPAIGAYQFRYHHRDSDAGLDLKHRYRIGPCPRGGDGLDEIDRAIEGLAGQLPIVGDPDILDLSDHDLESAAKIVAALPSMIRVTPVQ